MRCRDCPTDIMWLTHAKTGNRAPIESTPSDRGNIRIDRGRYVVLDNDLAADVREAAEEPLYLNHFATCPAARERRSR